MTRKCITCGTPPQPYYVDPKNSLTQDHAAIFEDTKFAAGIEIGEEFVVPSIGTDIQICVENLTNVVIGSYVWNPAYGYLKIVHWDECLKKIGLLTEDISGAAIPGTVVSEGTLFTVSPRPCCADQDNFQYLPFLAEDYVIPAVNASVILAVTSTFGLIEGTNIRIGSNVYFLDQINSSLEIVAINQGAGGTPGSTVNARDVNGNLQYLITQAVVSACIATGVDAGRIISCDGANEAILEGEYAGQVPVLQDVGTQEAVYQLLDADVRTCTFLTSVMAIVSATPSYTIDVDDESIFSVGQIIEIQGSALRWEITDNTTPGELDVTCTTGNPGVNVNLPIGSYVCLQLCCEGLIERVEDIEVKVATLETEVSDLQDETDSGWNTLSATGTYSSSFVFTVSGNVTSRLKVGQKLKLLLNGVEWYANIRAFSFGGGFTTITVISNTSYVLTNNPITVVQISNQNPSDFPPYFIGSVTVTAGFSLGSDSTFCIYWVQDSILYARIYVTGTSDASGFRLTLPAPFENFLFFGSNTPIGTSSRQVDAGSSVASIGMVCAFSTQEINVYKDGIPLNSWTNSGAKEAFIEVAYLLDQ